MKKIVCLVISVCLLLCSLSLTACGDNSIAFNSAIERTKYLTDYNCKMDNDITITMNGEEVTVKSDIELKISDAMTEEQKSYIKFNINSAGETVAMDIYTEGDYMYMSMEGVNYKVALDDAGNDFDYTEDVNGMLSEMPEAVLEDATIKENDDGSLSLSYNIPDEVFTELYETYIASIKESLGEILLLDKVTIKDTSVEIIVLKGYVTEYNIEFDMIIETGGKTVTADIRSGVEFFNPGEDVEVIPMEGYESFKLLQ